MSPVWLLPHIVNLFHDAQIEEHGGAPGVRDEGLLTSALVRPQNLFAYGTPTTFDLAAAYAFGLARNHPYLDGNKRISLVATAMFLELNGHRLDATASESVPFWIGIAGGQHDERAIASWLEAHCSPAPPLPY